MKHIIILFSIVFLVACKSPTLHIYQGEIMGEKEYNEKYSEGPHSHIIIYIPK